MRALYNMFERSWAIWGSIIYNSFLVIVLVMWSPIACSTNIFLMCGV